MRFYANRCPALHFITRNFLTTSCAYANGLPVSILIRLRKAPGLTFAMFLVQIGLAVSKTI
ncbi:hypothetical protein CEV33_1071 [Brucella grignonensis]|uniref:Uncharacterized protein n=1 Tax=Brucella grignonensis TaxID=94627 RepID=A0A256FBU4_9HYPH|nr:hypothetical protein CEV33_1071 [Brucella grignonensis]